MAVITGYNICLVLGLLFISNAYSEDCSRVFFGTVREIYPNQLRRNGIYNLQKGALNNGKPVYKHETSDDYIYFISNQTGGGNWTVGSAPGNKLGDMYVTAGPGEQLCSPYQSYWNVLVDGKWVLQSNLVARKVPLSFGKCHSDQLILEGIPKEYKMQQKVMGTYHLHNVSHNRRPVYKHEKEQAYLFYHLPHRLWVLATTLGDITGQHLRMFVRDDAFRPELIVHSWVINKHGLYLKSEQSIKFVCTAEDPVYGMVISGSSQIGNLTMLPSCSKPPHIANGHIASTTGREFYDLTVYKCRKGYKISHKEAAICNQHGEWSGVPVCESMMQQGPGFILDMDTIFDEILNTDTDPLSPTDDH